MNLNRRFIAAATLIVLAAALLRLASLNTIPPGLHYDEAANGVIVRNIAMGGYRPIFIPEYTGKEALWFYTAALIMKIAGPTVFSLRLTSALFGIVSVAATGWLARQLYPNDERRDALALIAMAVLAVAFWHGVLSRFADRAVTQPLLQAVSLGLLWKGLHSTGRRQLRWMALAGFATGLAAYTYLAVRLFPIVLAIALLVFLLSDARRIERIPGLLVYGAAALLAFAPLGWYFIQHPEAFSTRIGQVAPTSLQAAAEGWYLALRMFFLAGDPLMRFNLPGKPMFGPALAVFFVIGLIAVWRDAFMAQGATAKARGALLIVWPVVMLAPTALAVGGFPPSNLRAVGLAPLIALYPALGILELARRTRLHRDSRAGSLGRLAAPAAAALILVSGALTLRDLLRWGVETALYYDNDSHVAALARYLNEDAPASSAAYLATYHYRHPTLTFLAPSSAEARSLFGGEAVVLAPAGDTLIAYTRDALPPPEWQGWLEPYLAAAPLGPDSAPDFYAYLLPEEAQPDVMTVPAANFGNVIQLEGVRFRPARSGNAASFDAVWRILGAAPEPDYAFVAEVCDPYGWCWVRASLDGTLERGLNNTYPAAEWTPGERLLTRIDAPLPEGMPPGEYRVRIHIFSAHGSSRLPLVDAAGGFGGFYTEVEGLDVAASTTPDLDEVPMQVRLSEQAAPYVTLLGYDLPIQAARSGERVNLALHWLSEGEQPVDLDVTIRLGDETVLYRGTPVHGGYPLTRWQPNQMITDRYVLRIPTDLPAGEYPISVQLGDGASTQLASLVVQETNRQFEPPTTTALPEPALLGGQISLIGFDAPASLARGEAANLVLVWRAEAEIETAYTVFVHLIDAAGSILAQEDRQPFAGDQPYPSDLWLVGEVVADGHTLLIPVDAPSGEYRIRVGLYLQENGQRLSIPGTPDNAVILPVTLSIP